MKQIRLIKRNECTEVKTDNEIQAVPDDSKINVMMHTVRDWVEKNRSTKANSPRKQFSALFSN